MEFTTPLDEVDKELSFACLRCNTTDKEDHRTVGGEKLKKRAELNVGAWFGVEPLRAIRDVVHVMCGSYAISPLSIPLQ